MERILTSELAAHAGERVVLQGWLPGKREPSGTAMPPHGGFALGLERFVAQALGLANVREATLFPRDRSRLVP